MTIVMTALQARVFRHHRLGVLSAAGRGSGCTRRGEVSTTLTDLQEHLDRCSQGWLRLVSTDLAPHQLHEYNGRQGWVWGH
jgi:hypothetical protein